MSQIKEGTIKITDQWSGWDNQKECNFTCYEVLTMIEGHWEGHSYCEYHNA